jgi:hypothetical protein
MIITDNLSPQMIGCGPDSQEVVFRIKKISKKQVIEMIKNPESGVSVSFVCRKDRALLFSDLLGISHSETKSKRKLRRGNRPLILGDYKGPDIPFGVVRLPKSGKVSWYSVTSVVP